MIPYEDYGRVPRGNAHANSGWRMLVIANPQ